MKPASAPGSLYRPGVWPLSRPCIRCDGPRGRNDLKQDASVRRETRRDASSVPGPLKSRRRLGKRHLASIGALQPAPAPAPLMPWLSAWAGHGASVDLSMWRWEAPASTRLLAERLESRVALAELSRWASNVLPWWLNSRLRTDGLPAAYNGLLAQSSSASTAEDAPLHRQTQDALEAISTRYRDCAAQALRELAHTTRTKLLRCEATEAQLIRMLTVVPPAMAAANLLHHCCQELRDLCSAVLRRVTPSAESGPGQWSAALWDALLCYVSKLHPEWSSVQLFLRAMEAAPSSYQDSIRTGVLAALETIFASWSSLLAKKCRRATPRRMRPGQQAALRSALYDDTIQALARALKRFAPDGQDGVLVEATAMVSHLQPENALEAHSDTIRTAWLATLAWHPQVSEQHLVGLLTQFYGSGADPLSTLDLSRLFLASWASLDPSGEWTQTRARFEQRVLGDGQFAPLAALLESLYEREPRRKCAEGTMHLRYARYSPLTSSLWDSLRALGRHNEIVASLTAAAERAAQKKSRKQPSGCRNQPRPASDHPQWDVGRTIPVSLVRIVAATSGNVRLAIALRTLVTRFPGVFPDQFRLGRWDWRSWLPFLDAMLADPHISPTTVWELLGVVGTEDRLVLLNQTSALFDPSTRGVLARESARRENAQGLSDPPDKWLKHRPPWARPSAYFVGLVRRLIQHFAYSANYDAKTAYRAVGRGVFYLFWARSSCGGSGVARAVERVLERVLNDGLFQTVCLGHSAVETREASLQSMLGIVRRCHAESRRSYLLGDSVRLYQTLSRLRAVVLQLATDPRFAEWYQVSGQQQEPLTARDEWVGSLSQSNLVDLCLRSRASAPEIEPRHSP